MFTLISLAILSSNKYYSNIHHRKNIIENTCEFNTLRFQKNDVICIDLGQNAKYCNSNNLANEFVVNKEIGIGNKEVYIIKPTVMWEEIGNDRYRMADFYYSLHCNHQDNKPELTLKILPTPGYDISFETKIVGLFIFIVGIILLSLIVTIMCPCLIDDNNDSFCSGLLLGFLFSNFSSSNSNRRTYCE